ncbi:MAG: HAAS signaling domain-containing protein [Bacilli bacterium]
MNKKEYLKNLSEELKGRNIKNIEDIIDDYDDLIYQKMQQDLSEEDAINELGSVKDLADSYGTTHSSTNNKKSGSNMAFIILQVFNVFVGIAAFFGIVGVIFGIIGGIVGLSVSSVIMLILLVTGTFSSVATNLIAVAIALLCVFGVVFLIVLSKLLYKLLYNYVIFNINMIKEKKCIYKKIRVKKYALIVLATSFSLSLIAFVVGFSVSGDYWLNDGMKFIAESQGYNQNCDSTNPQIYELKDDIKSLTITGVDVEIVYGVENKVEYDCELNLASENGELIVSSKTNDSGFSRLISIDDNLYRETGNFLNRPLVKITTNKDFERIEVNNSNYVDIQDVHSENYFINSYRTELKLESSKNIEHNDLEINSTEFNVELENNSFESIDLIGNNGEMYLKNMNMDVLNVNAYNLNLDTHNVNSNEIDLSDVQLAELELNNTKIVDLNYDEEYHELSCDENTKIEDINNYKSNRNGMEGHKNE